MNIQNLSLSPFIVMGNHGVTDEEQSRPQRFSISISFSQDVARALKSDDLSDVVDYLEIKKAVVDIITGPSIRLLETLAEKVADALVSQFPMRDLAVTITKPDISENGVPSATVNREYRSWNGILDFDAMYVFRELALMDAVSIPILSPELRLELLEAFRQLEFRKMPEEVSNGLVCEDIWSADGISGHPRALRFRDDFTNLLSYKFIRSGIQNLFDTPLQFTELSLQYYKKGSFGITPHRDGKSMKNLICVFILEGESKFAICDDRAGNNPRYLDTTPGNVIILRAPGFMHTNHQPFHFVTDITSDRYVFGLRQKG